MTGSLRDNYSGFLVTHPSSARLSAAVILSWIFYLLVPHMSLKERILTAVLFAGSVLVPYREGTTAGLHLLFSYGSFLIINIIWIRVYKNDPKILQSYAALLFFCALLCLTASSVSGIAEALFMLYADITLMRALPQ